ncbi:MAG: hypothetical protein Q9228_006316, partial [Teloschistes exilis]
IGHQSEGVRVLDNDVIDIDGQELEPRALEQAANVPHIRQRRDMCGNAAAAVEVGELQARAEFEEGVPAEYGGDERAVGFQDRGDVGKEGREVVDPVEGEG